MKDIQPPYNEEEQAILNIAHSMIHGMRKLRQAVAATDKQAVISSIAYMRLHLRWLRSWTLAISRELKAIEGKDTWS